VKNPHPPKVIFHIGQHKTGSKALQSYLSTNRQNLLKHNIFYPNGSSSRRLDAVYQHSHFLLYALTKYECLNELLSNDDSENFWKEHKKFCGQNSVLKYFEYIEKRRKKYKAQTIIFSAEDLFDMQTAHELSFNQSFILRASNLLVQSARKVGWDPQLLVYLRRPDALLNAHYAQFIKGSDLNHLSFNTFRNAFQPRLDALNILTAWESSFSSKKIFVRPYEKNSEQGEIVCDFFENILGFLPDVNWLTPDKNLEFSNKTPPKVYIDLIRECNLARSKGLRTISRASILEAAFKDKTYHSSLNWMGSNTTQELLNVYMKDFRLIAAKYNGIEHADFFKQGWTIDDFFSDEFQAMTTTALQLSIIDGNLKHKGDFNFFSWLRKLIFPIA